MTHEPTAGPGPAFVPSTCWLCGRRAEGVGIGHFPSDRRPNEDPHFLCSNCVPLADQLKATTKFDHYETQAVEDVIDAVGPLVDQFGSDLAEWDDNQRREFVVAIVLGFGTSIRRQVRDGSVPF